MVSLTRRDLLSILLGLKIVNSIYIYFFLFFFLFYIYFSDLEFNITSYIGHMLHNNITSYSHIIIYYIKYYRRF